MGEVNIEPSLETMVLPCLAGSQAKKQARAAEAARREEERTAVKRAKEEAALAAPQMFHRRIFFAWIDIL